MRQALGGGSTSRGSSGHPNGNDYPDNFSTDTYDGAPAHNLYSHIRPARPAPPPPTSGSSRFHTRRGSSATSGLSGGLTSGSNSTSNPFGRRGSLGATPALSGLSASRPLASSSGFGDLPPLQLPPSGVGLRSPRLGSGELGSGLDYGGMLGSSPNMAFPPMETGGVGAGRRSRRRGGGNSNLGGDLPSLGGLNSHGSDNIPSLYSQSQPLDIESSYMGPNDWMRLREPAPELENPVNRETRREARHRTRLDWEQDGELHPNVDLESDLTDSTDGENDSPVGTQVRRRTRSIRRIPSMENLRLSAGDDSGFGLGRGEGHAPSSNFGLGGLDMEGGLGGLSLGGGLGGLSMGGGLGGLSMSGSGTGNFAPVNGQRERRGGFSNHETTSFEPLTSLELDPRAPLRRSRYPPPPPGPPPTGPLPPLPQYSSLSGLGDLGSLDGSALGTATSSSRRPPQQPNHTQSRYDPFAPPPPRIPGQHRIREHMLEFTDGDYTVRIRHNQRARQEQRNSSTTNNNADDHNSRLAQARRLGY